MELTQVGRYRLCFELASGGMATVYLARMDGPHGFEKLVALKRIHPHLVSERRYVEMFLDEARIASGITHPNVCTVFDFGESDGEYYLAMEYLVGEPLARLYRCRLTHMDRIYVGSQELVLIDSAKMTDQIETAPHVVCEVCSAVNGAMKRHCGECGKRLGSMSGATYKERRPRGSMPPSWKDPEDTCTAKTRDVIGGISAKAISMGRYDEAERMLLPHLESLLERAVRHRPLSNSDKDDPDIVFAAAIDNALQLAQGLRDPKWIDWVFRMHVATSRLMSAETIEALHDLVRSQEYHRRKYVRVYLQVIQNQASEYSPSERFLAGRLDGLSQVILARR